MLNARQAVTPLTMSPAGLYFLHLGSGGKVRYKSYFYLRYGGYFYTVFTREGESYKHLSVSAVNKMENSFLHAKAPIEDAQKHSWSNIYSVHRLLVSSPSSKFKDFHFQYY